jgi:hypothetical protein
MLSHIESVWSFVVSVSLSNSEGHPCKPSLLPAEKEQAAK